MLRTRAELRLPNRTTQIQKSPHAEGSGRVSDPRRSLRKHYLEARRLHSQRTEGIIPHAKRGRPKKVKTEDIPQKTLKDETPSVTGQAQDLVDWYSWGEAAFRKAKKEDKLIFLSVGYTNCYLCHVMETESFQHAEIAKLLNTNFVPVKVDKEELLDVDGLYGMFVPTSVGHSGWPLSVLLTPALDPVFGTTYIPTPAKDDLPSLEDVLNDMLDGWKNDKTTVVETGRESMQEINRMITAEPVPFASSPDGGTRVVDDLMDACADKLIETFDEKYGGFGKEKKHPNVSSLKLLLRQFARRSEDSDDETLSYVLKILLYTIGALHDGGVHDHIGGGFHRFSSDRIWHVPQFEKSLYDNAQIAQCFLAFASFLPEQRWFLTVRTTLDYLIRELKSTMGGFYTGQDADSYSKELGQTPEGAYYVWGAEEIKALLDETEYEIFADYYNVTDEGNCNLAATKGEEDVLTNCLLVQQRLDDLADKYGIEEEYLPKMLSTCRKKLFNERAKRRRPTVDETIVCGYNGLTLSAFAEAGRVLHMEADSDKEKSFPSANTEPATYLSIAREIGEFILSHLWDEKKQVLERFYRKDTASLPAYAEDYAYVIAGFLDLYTSSAELRWLDWAIKLQGRMDHLFWDSQYGGYFSSSADNQHTPCRLKKCFDGDVPSASSVAVSNLLRLSGILQDGEQYSQRAEETIAAFGTFFKDKSLDLPEFAASMFLIDADPSLMKIVIVGDTEDEQVQLYLNAMHSSYAPSKSLIAIDPTDKSSLEFWRIHGADFMEQLSDVVKPRRKKAKGKVGRPRKTAVSLPSVYICEGYQCAGPLESPEALKEYFQFREESESELPEVQGEEEQVTDVEPSSV